MKVQNPIIGRAKGSAGGMTFSKVYDKNVARAKAFEVNNPKTTAQQTQRAFFAELTALCSDFSDAQLRTLFPQKPKTMSRRNAISKQIAEYWAVEGTTKYIDFADIDTLGNAPVSNLSNADLSISGNDIIIDLSGISATYPDLGDYYVVAVVIDATQKKLIFTLDTAKLSSGEITIPMPDGWTDEDEINCIPLITNSKEDVSTKGFGSFIIKVRPEKKNR